MTQEELDFIEERVKANAEKLKGIVNVSQFKFEILIRDLLLNRRKLLSKNAFSSTLTRKPLTIGSKVSLFPLMSVDSPTSNGTRQ